MCVASVDRNPKLGDLANIVIGNPENDADRQSLTFTM